MADKYPLVSNSATKTIQELGVGDTLLVDNLSVTGEGNIAGNLVVGGDVTVIGNINADLGNVVVENLTVEGLSDLGPVGNITISGGSNNYVLRTDGDGNLTWANIQSEIANAAGSNTQVQFNNDNLFGASANFTYDSDTDTLTVNGTANLGILITANANISGGDANLSSANITTADITNLNTANANISDGIANLNTAIITGANIGTANITTLNAITSNLGAISNVHIAGGTNGYVLATDGSGNLSWVGIDPSVSGDGGNAFSSVLLLASLNGGNAISA